MKQKNAGDINRSLTKMQRRALAEALELDKTFQWEPLSVAA